LAALRRGRSASPDLIPFFQRAARRRAAQKSFGRHESAVLRPPTAAHTNEEF